MAVGVLRELMQRLTEQEELKRRALGRLLRSESARIVRKFRKDPRSETYAMTCVYVSLCAICGNRRQSTPILSVPLRKGGGRFVGVSCRGCPESTAWIACDGRGWAPAVV